MLNKKIIYYRWCSVGGRTRKLNSIYSEFSVRHQVCRGLQVSVLDPSQAQPEVKAERVQRAQEDVHRPHFQLLCISKVTLGNSNLTYLEY